MVLKKKSPETAAFQYYIMIPGALNLREQNHPWLRYTFSKEVVQILIWLSDFATTLPCF